MRITFCTVNEAKRFTNYLSSRYGISPSVFQSCAWITYQESVFLTTKEWVSLSTEKNLNLFSIGIQAFTDGKTFQPTTNFITLLGEHIRRNIVELPEEKMVSFFEGKKMPVEEGKSIQLFSPGWVAIRLNNKIIGSAGLKGRHLIPNLPFFSHAHENE